MSKSTRINRKNRLLMLLIVTLSVLLLITSICYMLYPTLLCDAIRRQTGAKDFLLRAAVFDINRNTQPDIFNHITLPLFETAAENPLVVACQKGDIETIQILLDKGADPNKQCGFYAIEALYASPRKDQRLEIAQMLCEHGADVTLHVGYYEAVFLELNYLKDEESWKNICFLLEQGASPVDEMQNTLLHYAVVNSKLFAVEKLLQNQTVDVDAQNSDGASALIQAAKYSTEAIVNLLIEYGADKTIVDKNGKTAYDYAIEQGRLEIAELVKP